MNCDTCGRAHRADARFCGGCGRAFAPRCPACGRESEPDAQFCEGCGAALVARSTAAAVARKVVTIVFADLAGSTALHERLDAESARRLMDRYYRTLHAAVDAHRGTVVKLLGDGVMAAFGVPRVAEDDAIRAVRAAVAMQHAFGALAEEQGGGLGAVGLRVAVNTGEVVVSADHRDVVGDPVNVAAHLQQQAQDGDVLVGEATRRLVGDLVTLAPVGALTLKGRAETVAAYRVVSLARPAGVPATAFVGREDEIGRLTAVYESAVTTCRARLAVILGSPGLGKSRLLDEFARRLGDGATVLTAHCDATGGATFAPIAETLRGALRLDASASGDALRAALEAVMPGDDMERGRIAAGIAAVLAGTPASPEETFFVVRRFLAALAAARPVLLVLDDLQWAEPLLLDLTEHLVQWSTTVPLLILVAARPELRDLRSSLAAPGGLVTEVVTLAGLDAGAATRLAANVIGAAELPAAVAGRVLATSEGNPLFVGELVRMLVHDGALKREGDRWTAAVEVATLAMPPTIHALLAGRIERLRPEERTVLERAAVVGRQFSRTAVAHLLPRDLVDLDARLESLRRSELIEPDPGWFLGEPVLRFHHVLIRDAAYRRLLKGTRAELHARVADWLESRAGDAVEHDETIGWHLEQAHQHLRELGPIDAAGRAIGERAARYLAAAGRRALGRDDVPLAASLLGRALDRLDAADAARADLVLDWCEALLAAGEVGPAAGAIDELGRFTGTSERLRAWHTCFAGQRAALTDPQALHATADAVAGAADALAKLGDAAGEAKAHFVHAIALARLGRVGACEAALDRALAAARRGHDRRRANAVLAGAPLAALWGPSPVTRASGRCLDVVRVLRITQGAPAVEAVALRCQAVLEALRGRTEAARRMIASSRHLVEELGITQRLLEADVFAGLIELLEGDAVAAEHSLRAAYDGLRTHGLGIDAAQAAALLGRALLAQDRAAEAEALSLESEALAGDDLQAAMAWRGVRAEALARRGEPAAAVEFARAAVELAAATDALLYHADARLALAAALRAAGRSDQAAAEEARAIELWEAKGATLLAERARGAERRPVEVDRAPAARAEPARSSGRRVRPNAATAHAAREDAAFAAHDHEALAASFADEAGFVDHANGVTLDRLEILTTLGPLLRVQDLTRRHEPLATLGDALALCRLSVTGGGIARGDFDVGAYENEAIILVEVDAQGRCRRAELFAEDRLGAAVARLCERYADILPDGPDRTRAAVTAQVIAALPGPPEHWLFAPDVDAIDHRTVGFGSVRGLEPLRESARALLDLVEDSAVRVDDVLALRPDACLFRWTHSGTDRHGGAFTRHICELLIFGADGLATRWERFDAEHDAEALARFDDHAAEAVTRFDELTAGPAAAQFASAPSRAAERRRRVRPNAATANAARLDAAVAARDAEACASLLTDHAETVHHPTGITYDREGALARVYSIFKAKDATFAHEPLATLGDTLALCRMSWSASGATGGGFDVGAYENAQIALIEVDARGQRRRAEFFAEDRLGDAVARLYERCAELLPDGAARDRAAATARAVAATLGAIDLDRYATAFARDVQSVDHRILGTWCSRGADALLQHYRSVLEVAADVAFRNDEILDLRSNALLMRRTHLGTARAGGGAYERQYLAILGFGADGLVTHNELFDCEREAEALARFDELTAEAPPVRPRRVRPNAATANAARVDLAIATQDVDAFPALWADESEAVGHETRTTWDRQGSLVGWRSLLRTRDPKSRHEPLATLGDSLALCRWSTSGSGFAGRNFDVGAYEREEITLVEVDAQGRRRRTEAFALPRLGDAVTRLYERYADLLPDGPARDRAAATARSVAALPVRALVGPADVDRYAAALAPAIDFIDRRTFGVGSTNGAEAYIDWVHALFELADDVGIRIEEILGLRSDALLVRLLNSGTQRAGGGAFERQFLILWVFGADGLVARLEQFDVDHEDEALARFDALTAESAAARPVQRRVRANAATASSVRTEAAIAARDADALAALFAEEYELVNHPTGVTYGRQGELSSLHAFVASRDPILRHEPLATLGDSLMLYRLSMSASGFAGRAFDVGIDVGAYDRATVNVLEVDARGRRRRTEEFAPDRLGDAIARLYERYAELLPDGPVRDRAAATARSIATMAGPLDPDRWAGALAPDIESIDHRTLGTWSAYGAAEMLQHLRALLDLSDGVASRIDDVLALRPEAKLVRRTAFGTDRAGGGAYERPYLVIEVFGSDGRLTRMELFDSDRDAEALARFDELVTAAPAVRFENAATRFSDRFRHAWEARDWERVAAGFAPELRVADRRRMVRIEFDRDTQLESLRLGFEMRSSRFALELLATRGDRLALVRVRFEGSNGDVGASEIVFLEVEEVNDGGEGVALVVFDPDDLDAAYAELDARFAAGEAAPYPGTWRTMQRLQRALAARDCEQLASALTPDFVLDDHRPLGWGTRSRDELLVQLHAMVELAPDVRWRRDDHVLAIDRRGALHAGRWIGTREGGTFEIPIVTVIVLGPDTRIHRLHTYDPEQREQARACFDALEASAAGVPLRIPPNAATRAFDRWREAIVAENWEAAEAAYAPTLAFDDRRRGILVTGDRQMLLASDRVIGSSPRIARTVVATAGDRLALQRVSVAGTSAVAGFEDVAFEVDVLQVIEVDRDGGCVAAIWFDPDDRRAASEELFERYARSNEAPWLRAACETFRAINDHDLDRLRATLHDDFVDDDHRRTGVGRLEGADTYVASLRPLFESAPDLCTDNVYWIAVEKHGGLAIGRTFGTRAEGGEFESVFVRLLLYRGDRLIGVEHFEPEHLALARARFEELRP